MFLINFLGLRHYVK